MDDDVFIIFEERQLSTDVDFQNDGYIIVWDNEEIGRNLSTSELIEKVGEYDNDLYCEIINFCYRELELVHGEHKDDLDNLFFDEVFEFIQKNIGAGLFYKFHYQNVSFVDRVYKTEVEAKEYVDYCNAKYKNKKYFCRYKVIDGV